MNKFSKYGGAKCIHLPKLGYTDYYAVPCWVYMQSNSLTIYKLQNITSQCSVVRCWSVNISKLSGEPHKMMYKANVNINVFNDMQIYVN